MRIYTKIVIDMATGTVLERVCGEYTGPVEECKGSSSQDDLAQKQAAFYDTLTSNYKTQFGEQSAILSALQKTWSPILSAGINQYGFNPQEDSALRTQAGDATSANFSGANRALNENIAAAGGGDQFLPSGSKTQLEQQNQFAAARDISSQNLGITQAGYEQGRQNFLNASSALTGQSQIYDPQGYAKQGNSAGESAFSSASILYNQGQAWQGLVGGILGGAATAFAGPLGGAAAGALFPKAGGGAAAGGGGS